MKPYYQDSAVTIYHGDCREILPTLEKKRIRLLWTDPPYGHNNQSGDLAAGRVRDNVRGARKRACVPILNDGPESMRSVVDAAFTLAAPLLIDDCCCCCCCCGGGGPSPTFAWFANRLDSQGLAFFHAVVWDKSGRGHGMGWRFRRDYEFVMVSHKAGGKLSWSDPDTAVPNIVFVAPPDQELHPNEKPIALVSYFAQLTTEVDELILDPFMGSGTTLEAAKNLGRRAIGIELEERYCEIAAKRMAQEVFPL